MDLVTREDIIVERNETLHVILQMGPGLDPSIHVEGKIQITIVNDDSEYFYTSVIQLHVNSLSRTFSSHYWH